MLRILTETEAAVRRSANPRLALESLLLRWAVMDRTVNLEAVLRTGGRAGGPTGRSTTDNTAPADPPVRPSARPPVDVPPARPPARPSANAEFSGAGLQAIWPEVVEAGRAESRFLAEALAACTIVSATPPNVVVRLSPDQAHMLAPIEKGR